MDSYAGPYREIWTPRQAGNVFIPLTPAFPAAKWGQFIWKLEYTSVTGTGSGHLKFAPVMGLSYDGFDWPTNVDLTNPQTFTTPTTPSGWVYAQSPLSAMLSGGIAPRPFVNFGVIVEGTNAAFGRARMFLQDAL